MARYRSKRTGRFVSRAYVKRYPQLVKQVRRRRREVEAPAPPPLPPRPVLDLDRARDLIDRGKWSQVGAVVGGVDWRRTQKGKVYESRGQSANDLRTRKFWALLKDGETRVAVADDGELEVTVRYAKRGKIIDVTFRLRPRYAAA